MKQKTFNIFTICLVILTGAGFGIFTALFYYEKFWWVGMAAGGVTSYFLAKWYLHQLVKMSVKNCSNGKIFLKSILLGVLCGIICTAIVHAVMYLTAYPFAHDEPGRELNIFELDVFIIAIAIGEVMGSSAGLTVAAICSSIYISLVKGKTNEGA